MAASSTQRTRPLAIVAVVIAISAMLRLVPCFNAFWLDEVWSYFWAREIGSPLEVFTGIHHSNNHHLPTLWLYGFGDTPDWFWYRTPSLLAGIGTVVLAAYLSWQRGVLDAVLVSILFGFSFLLIQYSSEARGYACALFFALLSFAALLRYLERGGWRSGIVFGLSAILGVLSQLIYLLFYASLVLWGFVRVRRIGERSRSRPPSLAAFLRLQTIPLAAFLALYLIDLRHMEVESGDSLAWHEVLGKTIGSLFGLPSHPGAMYALPGALLLASGVRLLARRNEDTWILLLCGTLTPVLAILVARPEVVAPRYFIIAAALLLGLAGHLLAALFRRGRAGQIATVVAMLIFLGGSATYTARFLKWGRGGYPEAMRYLVANTAQSDVVVGVDHEFRTGIVLRFYSQWVAEGRGILIATTETWPVEGPEWVITHRSSNPEQAGAEIRDVHGNPYRLEAAYPFTGLSGFFWAIYHNLRYVSESEQE